MKESVRISTIGISVGNFRPHGEMQLHISGKLNILELRGPFNRELVTAAEIAQEQLDHLLVCHRHWGTLLAIKDSALTPCEALFEIYSIVRRRIARGMKPSAVGIVLEESVEGASFMAWNFAKAYTDADILARTFLGFDEASSMGFRGDRSQRF